MAIIKFDDSSFSKTSLLNDLRKILSKMERLLGGLKWQVMKSVLPSVGVFTIEYSERTGPYYAENIAGFVVACSDYDACVNYYDFVDYQWLVSGACTEASQDPDSVIVEIVAIVDVGITPEEAIAAIKKVAPIQLR